MTTLPTLYRKLPKTLEEQVQILASRGVRVSDAAKASAVLGRLNYYRFCGYGLFFEEFSVEGKRLDRFKSGTTFEQILNLYHWDEALRHLLREALAWVEISFRTAFIYEMAITTKNPFWHLDAQWMNEKYQSLEFEKHCHEAVNKADELFTKHFKEIYPNDVPPCWMLTEVMSFGKWSRLLGCIKHKNNVKKIAHRLGAPPDNLVSWIRALVILRNRCAHHGRLWDYSFKIRPSLTPAIQKLDWPLDHVGVMIWIIADLLRKEPERRNDFIDRLKSLLNKCPEAYTSALGIKNIHAVWA